MERRQHCDVRYPSRLAEHGWVLRELNLHRLSEPN